MKPLAISASEILDVWAAKCYSSVLQVAHSTKTNCDILCLNQIFLGRTELAVSDIARLFSLNLHVTLLEHDPEIVVHTHAVFLGRI